jgi:Phosphoserine aminotransferase
MRIHNFSAGPSTLPLAVLERARDELVEYHGAGMSLVEMSHRGPRYDAVHHEAMRLVRELLEVPEEFAVLFLQGGATLQFAMVPMNLLHAGERGAYADTGTWAGKALADAAHHGAVYRAWDGAPYGYRRTPHSEELELTAATRYLHITSNETIGGIRYPQWPDVTVPLVADMSSDYLTRPVPWERFDLVYGGVQKNLGPAGAALVIVRRSTLEHTNRDLAAYLRYDVHAAKDSLYNTPPVFTIWIVAEVLRWVRDRGGVPAMEAAARRKAELVYGTIDASGGFYRSPVDPESRSLTNVVFRLADEDLEARFLEEAAAQGLSGLKGHRSVGGCRASLYNALEEESVRVLTEFMRDFQARNG